MRTVSNSNLTPVIRKRKKTPVFWQGFIAVTTVLFLNYSTEIILYSSVLPKVPEANYYQGFWVTFASSFRYFLSHLIVATILMLLFEIPRKRIKIRWWHIIILALICFPAASCVEIINSILLYRFKSKPLDSFSIPGLIHLKIVIMSMLAYGLIVFWDNSRKERELVLQAESLINEARWQMLRYQVNPHFLFNSLNSVMSLINSDRKLARSVVNELSNYFRYTLSLNDTNVVALSQELAAARHYLSIQKVRFEERLSFEVILGAGTEDLLIPVFGVQTLIENAVKYGLKTSRGRVFIEVKSYSKNQYFYIVVVNTGKIFMRDQKDIETSSEGTNSGLENLRQRLNLLYPENIWFSLEEKDNTTVVAEIRIAKGKKQNLRK
jgi:hypothetical protein